MQIKLKQFIIDIEKEMKPMIKKGDKVKIISGDFKGKIGEVKDTYNSSYSLEGIYAMLVEGDDFKGYFFVENLELVSTEYTPSQEELNYLENDVCMTYTAYKNLKAKEYLNALYGTNGLSSYCDTDSVECELNDILKPNHYQGKNGDLFDEWYERYPFDVFRIVLLSTAERYFRRYHLKDGLDGLNKGIEVMKRLEDYELKEKTND